MKLLLQNKFITYYGVKYFSTTIYKFTPLFNLPFKYKTEDEEKILNTLNTSSKDTLLGLKVPRNKIKNLENYKNKKGEFHSLNDILEVEGFGVQTLKKICDRIITGEFETIKEEESVSDKRLRQLITPNLPTDIESCIGVHVESTGCSWAKLNNKDNRVIKNWGYEDFGTLPTKLQPHETFTLAHNILSRLPNADVYVFEGSKGLHMSQTQASAKTSYHQQLELTSMLLALINITPYFKTKAGNTEVVKNKVYFLRPNLPARLFKTLVGNERVSTSAAVLQLINGEKDLLPCSPINLDSSAKAQYLAESATHRELLGRALLLLITFKEVCIVKNPTSINVIYPRNKKVK